MTHHPDWSRVGPQLLEALERIAADGYDLPQDATDAQLALYWALQTRRRREIAHAAIAAAKETGK